MPFIVRAVTIIGIERIRFNIFFDFRYLSNKKIIHGNNANASISGLYTKRIEIEGGKKLTNIKVGKITFNEKSKYLSKK